MGGLDLLTALGGRSGSGLTACLESEVEVSVGHIGVGHNEENSDTASERAEECPKSHNEVDAEELPSVAVHHSDTLIEAGLPILGGIVLLNVESHGLGIALNDTGDDEEHRPEEGEEALHKAQKERVNEVLGKSLENVADLNGGSTASTLYGYSCHTVAERAHNDDGADYDIACNAGNNAGNKSAYQDHEPMVRENIIAKLCSGIGFYGIVIYHDKNSFRLSIRLK